MHLDGGPSGDEMSESISELPSVSELAYKRPSAVVSKNSVNFLIILKICYNITPNHSFL